MADEKNWIREAMFYHIYPLGFTGAPLRNEVKQRQADGF